MRKVTIRFPCRRLTDHFLLGDPVSFIIDTLTPVVPTELVQAREMRPIAYISLAYTRIDKKIICKSLFIISTFPTTILQIVYLFVTA